MSRLAQGTGTQAPTEILQEKVLWLPLDVWILGAACHLNCGMIFLKELPSSILLSIWILEVSDLHSLRNPFSV